MSRAAAVDVMQLLTHSCMTHRVYHLTCEQYDELREAAGGRCQRCGQEGRLVIDHDHAGGMAAVRGLVCPACNARLRRVDAMAVARDDLDDKYLESAWHTRRRVPFVLSRFTKIRTVRVDDELWQAAQEKAKRRRETVAAVIKRALLAYVEDEK